MLLIPHTIFERVFFRKGYVWVNVVRPSVLSINLCDLRSGTAEDAKTLLQSCTDALVIVKRILNLEPAQPYEVIRRKSSIRHNTLAKFISQVHSANDASQQYDDEVFDENVNDLEAELNSSLLMQENPPTVSRLVATIHDSTNCPGKKK